MSDEDQIRSRAEVLAVLSQKAREGSTSAMIALERALRARERDADDRDENETELDRTSARPTSDRFPRLFSQRKQSGRAGTTGRGSGNRRGCRKHDATPSQVALAWLLARYDRMLLIPGTTSVAHLEGEPRGRRRRADRGRSCDPAGCGGHRPSAAMIYLAMS